MALDPGITPDILASQPGITSEDLQGYGSTGASIDPTSGISASQGIGAASLGVGALGLGTLLAKGPSPLPAQYGQLQGMVPGLTANAQSLEAGGASMLQAGQQTVAMGAAGTLTAPQQATLDQYNKGLTNQARQQFYSMNRNPDQDTAFINQTGNIDAQTNAMAQQMIQSTLATGFGMITAGNQETSAGLQFQTQADQILFQAAQAQVQQDNSFNTALTSAFTAIGGMAAKAAPLLLAA